MFLFYDKKERFSVIRTGITFGVIGLLFVVGGFLLFQLELNGRRVPLDIALPDGAVEWSQNDFGNRPYRELFYQVPGVEPEVVVEHYANLMNDYDGECLRFPPAGDFPDYDPNEGQVPYYYRCFFDASYLDSVQWTDVQIEPGVPNEDEFLNSEGATVIVYKQEWDR